MQCIKFKNMKKRIIACSIVTGLIYATCITAFSVPVLNGGATWFTRNWIFETEQKEQGTIDYYHHRYESLEKTYEESKKLALDIQQEGSTLLKNEGRVLPFAQNERKISVFGTGSINIAHGGTGSGDGNTSGMVSLYSAFKDAGFDCNPELKRFYENKYKQGYHRGSGTDMNGGYFGSKGNRDYGYSINEVERDAYKDVRKSYEDYNDAAIIVISRSGGEGQDLPTSMKEFYEGDDKHYLELTDEEIELFQEVKEAGFHKTILLLNTLNPFECGFIEDPSFGIDAAIHIGGPGRYGLIAVAEMLKGDRPIEGHLADTQPKNMLSLPSMQNYGDNHFTEEGKDTTACYVSYNENMYIGYRYYETIYEDHVLNRFQAEDYDYESEVAYPFGYGLSYSEFEWSNESFELQDGTFHVYLDVKNVGSFACKDTVQVYLQKPYTEFDIEHHIEKPAAELIAYEKTKTLQPNEIQRVELTFSQDDLASYATYVNEDYLIEKGDYFISLAHNAHDAIDSILSQKGHDVPHEGWAAKHEQAEEIEINRSRKTNYPIENRFETERYSSLTSGLKMLTRSAWKDSFPEMYGDSGVPGQARMTLDIQTKTEILNQDVHSHLGPNDDEYDYVYNWNDGETKEIKIQKKITSSGEGLNFMDLVDKNGQPLDYFDPKWDKLVQCLSEKELYEFLSFGGGRSEALLSINKRLTITSDSPMGLHVGTLFPCYPIQAGTFDKGLATRMGEQIAEEALWHNIRGWYSPTCNIHRHPFGGRNYEYYSEDPHLAGLYVYSVVRAVQANGVFVQVKHFAVNDQDTNRGDRGNFRNEDPYNGLITYANEQSIREIYLKVFQYAIEKADGHGVMTSYNRIGTTWSGGHYGLTTEVLRNEWGLKGNALTDYAGTFGYKYMNMNQGLRAGNDVWLHPKRNFPIDDKTSDAAIYYMQKAAKHILYAEACSSRVNNQRFADGTSVKVHPHIYTWQWAVIGLMALVALIDAAILIPGFVKAKKKAAKSN